MNSNNQITAISPVGATTGPIRATTGAGNVVERDELHARLGHEHHVVHPDDRPGGHERRHHRDELRHRVTSVKFNGVTATSLVTNTATSDHRDRADRRDDRHRSSWLTPVARRRAPPSFTVTTGAGCPHGLGVRVRAEQPGFRHR